jgi:hypothetical protein
VEFISEAVRLQEFLVPTLLLQTVFAAFYKSYDKLCISSFICYPHALASGIPVGSLTAMPSDKVRLISQTLLHATICLTEMLTTLAEKCVSASVFPPCEFFPFATSFLSY